MTGRVWPQLFVAVSLALGIGGCGAEQGEAESGVHVGQIHNPVEDRLNKAISSYRGRLNAEQSLAFDQAQTAWLQYREAACAFQTGAIAGGSAHSMVLGQCYMDKARQRLAEIEFLSSCQEGDLACPTPR